MSPRHGDEVVFRDPTSHTSWRVREEDCPDGAPARRGQRCLIFESESAVRRVWHYPANWRELSPAQLIALSWAR